jgi:SAM-dependent methyltransferase
MTAEMAATWIAPVDEADRARLLGAAVAAAQREDRRVAAIVEGAGEIEAALISARDTGLLILPEPGSVLPDAAWTLTLLRRAKSEGWRLLLLTQGADSAAESGERAERLLTRMAAMPRPPKSWQTPPQALRRRVSGGSEDGFFRSGLMHVEDFDACLAEASAPLADAEAVLEWGAGCGRMTTHILNRAPSARVTAADTDAEAIAWVGENLGVHRAEALPLLPPSDLDADAFDVVVGHSVFSHLGPEAQDGWLEELARVTRPGGHIAVSFNGPVALRWHLEHPLVEVPTSVEANVSQDGIAVWEGDGWEAEFYEGYHTTFHRHDYVREHWSQWVDVVAIHEAAAGPTQDIAVLRAR